MVRKCTGYCFFVDGGVSHDLLLLTTILLSSGAPQLAIWLLLQKCSLNKAVFVRVKVSVCRHMLDFCQVVLQTQAS